MKGLPEPVIQDFMAVRRLFRETFLPGLDSFEAANRKPWEDVLVARFKEKTGQDLLISHAGNRIPLAGDALAQRIPYTRNSRITLKQKYSLFEMGHEFAHALQNTFQTLMEPLLSDRWKNAFGEMTMELRGVIQGFQQLYESCKKAVTPDQMNRVKQGIEAGLSGLSPQERKQIRLWFLEEWQAQDLSAKMLRPFTHPRLQEGEALFAQRLRKFAEWVSQIEQKLAGEA
jgi:hypothetical protein